MTRRVVLGRRGADGAFGLWVTKPGFDANAVQDHANLLLAADLYTDQLILNGFISSLPAFVPFTLTQRPFVLLTNTELTVNIHSTSGDDGMTTSFTSVSGLFMRPFPVPNATTRNVEASVAPTGMTISNPGGDATGVVAYAVWRRRLS